eukprot:Sspe_Gene.119868::Locus_117013_Transcript_1_1_Confidence_1.000_Length_900::g.119868::m.119868
MSPPTPAEDVKSFLEHGYAVYPGLLQGDDLKRILDFVDSRILADPDSEGKPDAGHWNKQGFLRSDTVGGRVYKVQGVSKFLPETLDLLFRHPLVVDRVKRLFGEARGMCSDDMVIDVFGTKFFPIWPKVGKSVNWHQDSYFFGSDNSPLIISAAFYLEDTDSGNGCFRVVPKSHTTGMHEHKPGEGEWAEGEWMTVEEKDALDVHVPKGTVVLFDARLVHSARPNTSEDRTRKSFFGHYVPHSLQFAWRGTDFSSGAYDDRHRVH